MCLFWVVLSVRRNSLNFLLRIHAEERAFNFFYLMRTRAFYPENALILASLPAGEARIILVKRFCFKDAMPYPGSVPLYRGEPGRMRFMEKPDLSTFPATPGVYLYQDAGGRIIYVGKARKLRHRIASYFRDESSLTPKTRSMIRHAVSIDILRTGTEKEALLLEASLIKKHRPRYNIVLRDDKEYLLFRIGREHPYPRVEIIRHNSKARSRNADIFGPFSSGSAARETWQLLHKYFPLRRCRDRAFANRTRPCLYYDMGQCLAPCCKPVPQEEYQAIVRQVSLLLSGRSRELVSILKKEMESAAAALQFERAARLRDQLRAVERTLERQSVVLAAGTNIDLMGVAQMPEGLALGIVFVRDGLLLDGRNFFWPGLTVEDTPELTASFLAQFYLSRQGLGESIPSRIVVPWLPDAPEQPASFIPKKNAQAGRAEMPDETAPERAFASGFTPEQRSAPNAAPEQIFVSGAARPAPEEVDGLSFAEPLPEEADSASLHTLAATLAEYRGGPVYLSKPRTAEEDSLILMAISNAREAARNKTLPVMAEILADRLHAVKPLRRIEVVDISHTSGKQTRAGMVVWEDEEPVTRDYRAYALDEQMAEAGIEAGDDYAALAVWAARRAGSGPPWADLVLVDGGKGQLAAVHRAFCNLGLEKEFTLASIAKARTEDGKADRRAGNVSDRIFLPGRSNPVILPPGSPELLYLQRIRDAAHDFVIGRHRRARAAATLSGELTRLPGVGPKLARQLFERFGSLAAMAEAGEDALRQVPGIGRERAALISRRLALLVDKKKA